MYSSIISNTQFFNSFSTMTCFHIHSAYYLVTFYSFRNSCGGLK
ncbi:hypothetical protein E2C01_013677 [Portunus trituberculatus]|uniref:Uncharacterized protein n=1 Tax=Portunus trituberculatus TaxID=210409 RepID=A0A5B7DHV4_PORTR|nr:hypothetical protein [Portunus trituberculatus]